jgi:hypothetical protein
MVVPFPNPTGGRRFGLISGNDTRLFRQQYREKFRSSEIHLEKMRSRSSYDAMEAEVFTVGNYICSVVPNLAELHASINWSEFDVPADFKERMAVFDDRSIIDETCGFVVAKAIKNVKDDGFGIVYPDDGMVYFPTCHENEPSKRYSYDVCLYAFNEAPEHIMPDSATIPGVMCSEVSNSSPVVSGESYSFPMIFTDGSADTLLTINTSQYSHVSFRHIKGHGVNNSNIIYRQAPDDHAASEIVCGCKTPKARQLCLICNGQLPVDVPGESPTAASKTDIEHGSDIESSSVPAPFRDVLQHGTFFSPAWKHYGAENITVWCDKCESDNLPWCLGYGTQDLCLSCASDVSKSISKE